MTFRKHEEYNAHLVSSPENEALSTHARVFFLKENFFTHMKKEKNYKCYQDHATATDGNITEMLAYPKLAESCLTCQATSLGLSDIF